MVQRLFEYNYLSSYLVDMSQLPTSSLPWSVVQLNSVDIGLGDKLNFPPMSFGV